MSDLSNNTGQTNRREDPRAPRYTDYPSEERYDPWIPLTSMDKNIHPPVDSIKIMHTLEVDVQNNTLVFDRMGEELARTKLSLQSIRALYHPTETKQYEDGGIQLRISRRDLMTPLGFEALLQTVMMNMISYTYPRMCRWSPLKKRLNMFNLNTEANHIRNGVLINELNHLHILTNRLAGMPILMALPGPSLDIDYIRKNRSSFVLMACGRACQKLFEAGIDPDIAYVQDINATAWGQYFDFLGDRKTSTTLIANPAGRIWKYAKNFKRVFKAWNLYPFETDIFPRIEEIAPSTTSGAYSVARSLGCNPILIMGNDSGSNTPSAEMESIPESLTNLDFEEDGDKLLFCPTEMEKELFLRFGDEFSVMTQNDYIAGIQWLKIKAAEDIVHNGIQVYDFSSTGLSRFNSPIMEGATAQLDQKVTLPEFPAYHTNYDMEKYVQHKKSTYSFLQRQLEKGALPKAAWRFPNSCILTHTIVQISDNMHTLPMDVRIAKDNTAFLLEHIDIALEELAERKAAGKP